MLARPLGEIDQAKKDAMRCGGSPEKSGGDGSVCLKKGKCLIDNMADEQLKALMN
jgi:hypothetical protein